MANENKKVITLICERAAAIDDLLGSDNEIKDVPGLHAVKLPCSGMIQAGMIEKALSGGAAGVIVCGCQIGDCYYREGNKMIRERLLGERTPGLKKNVDRRRVMALWLSRVQQQKFVAESKEFVAYVRNLEPAAAPAAAAAAKPAAKPAEKPAAAAAEKPAEKPAAEKADDKKEEKAPAAEQKTEPAAPEAEKGKPGAESP